MKLRLLAFLSLGLVLTLPSTAHAGKRDAAAPGDMPVHRILKRFDTNGNGIIDPGPESDALRAAFEKNPKLKYLDTNKDGKLDDAEIAAIKGKHKKKNDPAA